MHGHRRSGAIDAGLVACPCVHTAAAQPADEHGTPPQGWPGQLLDGREERVHVEVQHPARIHTSRCYGHGPTSPTVSPRDTLLQRRHHLLTALESAAPLREVLMATEKTDFRFNGVRIVHSDELDTNTPQSPGMNRAAAINAATAGA